MVFEDALAGVASRPGGRVRLRGGGRPARTRPRRCASTARTSSSATSPTCWRRGHESRPGASVHRRALGRARAVARHGRRWAITETVFALSNGHIGLRGNLDEGEPHATPGHLPQLLLRAAPAAVRRGRLRLPGVRPDHHQRHQRQDHPAAGGRRAVRPALRPAAPPPARARPAVRHADPRGAVEQPGGQDRQGAQRAAGLAHPAGGRRDLLRGRGRAARADRGAVRARGQRAAADDARAATRGSRRRCTTRWSPSSTAATTRARRWCTTRATRGCGWPRRWTTRSAGPRARRSRRRPARTSAGPRSSAASSRAPCCGWSSTWPTAGRRGGRCPRCTTRSVPGLAAARYTGLGRAARRAARVPRRLLDHRGRRDRRRRGAAAGRARRGVPRAAGRRAGGAAGDRRQGPDRPRLRRPHVLGHRDLLPAGAQPPRSPTRRRTRCAGASRSCRWPTSGPSSWASPARPSRGGRSAARSARATGRPARRRSTSTPTSPTPCGGTC